jgi:hypothetical protein
MKTAIFFPSFVIVMILLISSTVAQVSSTANVSANIVHPISIAKDVDMSFGNVAVNTSSGTVILNPAGSRSATNGVTLPADAGNVSAASFTVSGEVGYTYSITLPGNSITLSRLSGSETMTVDGWTSSPSNSGVLTDGSETLNIGATLYVTGSQVPGVYSSNSPLLITVNYN